MILKLKKYSGIPFTAVVTENLDPRGRETKKLYYM